MAEREALIDGVFKGYGWRKIQDHYKHVFQGQRTNVDLKDKWRNIAKQVGGNKKPRGPEGPLSQEAEMRVLKVLRGERAGGEAAEGEGAAPSSGSDE